MEHIVFVDSRLRDTSTHITPAHYIINLQEPIKNIKSIELSHAIYNKNQSNTEKYALLCIKEVSLKRFVLSNTLSASNVFAYLPFYKEHEDIYEYEFTSQKHKTLLEFEPPLTELTTLSISILDKDGKLFPIQEHIICFSVCSLPTTNNEPSDKDLTSLQPIPKTPYDILDLKKGNFTLELLVDRFKQKAQLLRKSGTFSQSQYNELKGAFQHLANTLQKRCD